MSLKYEPASEPLHTMAAGRGGSDGGGQALPLLTRCLVTNQRVEKAVVATLAEGGVVPQGATVVVATLVSVPGEGGRSPAPTVAHHTMAGGRGGSGGGGQARARRGR